LLSGNKITTIDGSVKIKIHGQKDANTTLRSRYVARVPNFGQRISNCVNLLATEGNFLQITNDFGGVAQLVRA
jgi:hypothetical protein